MILSLASVLLIAEMLGVLLAVDAIMRPRSSRAAVGWLVALVCLPVLAIPLYLVIGRTRFRGYAEAIREKEAQLDQQFRHWYARMASLGACSPPRLGHLDATVQRLTGVPFTSGNQVDLLIDAEATYAAMLAAIAQAENYVLVQFYIVRDDDAGRALQRALIERARAGVRVYFLYDEVGSFALGAKFLETMREESIEVSGFRTTRGVGNRFQINFRNHRKLMIIDGRVGFIGGLNLGDEYLTYRDTHLRLKGPAAQQLQLTFRKDWYWATRRVVELADEPCVSDDPGLAVSIVNTGPADPVPKCSILFSSLVASAAKRLWIASPYFVPDDVMTRALQSAGKRGVDVRILVPDKSDLRIVQLASLTYYTEMMDCGVRLFRYQGAFLHHKAMLIDDELAAIGTVNFDCRSLYLNFEETALVADTGFARQVGEMFEADLRMSQEVVRGHFESQPIAIRVQAKLARLASPLL